MTTVTTVWRIMRIRSGPFSEPATPGSHRAGRGALKAAASLAMAPLAAAPKPGEVRPDDRARFTASGSGLVTTSVAVTVVVPRRGVDVGGERGRRPRRRRGRRRRGARDAQGARERDARDREGARHDEPEPADARAADGRDRAAAAALPRAQVVEPRAVRGAARADEHRVGRRRRESADRERARHPRARVRPTSRAPFLPPLPSGQCMSSSPNRGATRWAAAGVSQPNGLSV